MKFKQMAKLNLKIIEKLSAVTLASGNNNSNNSSRNNNELTITIMQLK